MKIWSSSVPVFRLLLTVLLLSGYCGIADTAPVKIRGAKLGNWWLVGETVNFRAVSPETAKQWKGLIAAGENRTMKVTMSPGNNFTAIIGTVNDSTGKVIAEQKIDIKSFLASGWNWKPAEPGFYTVKFTWLVGGEKTIPAEETLAVKLGAWSSDGKTYKHFASREFSRSVHNFAVLALPPRPPSEIPPQAGFHAMTVFKVPADLEWYRETELDLTVLLGGNYLRVHGGWAKVAVKPGEYDWKALDQFYRYAVAKGFRNFIFNPFGTPRWASTRPERNEINICLRGYEAFLPVKLSCWTDYLTALMRRYPLVRNWELWNEPHLPGQSVFWYDTPENFVKLLQAGYECVKHERPDNTVIIGGMGQRYLSFYDKIIKMGAGKYFDVLALHGQWNNPAPFHQIERQVGMAPKPWLNSEYYPVMLNNDVAARSEENLSRNMLLSFMDQLRQGASAVTLFLAVNYYYNNETEVMAFFRENKKTNHTAGFFRRSPYIEPRLAAVVWRNFIDCFSGKMSYRDGFFFANGEQRAALMESNSGNVLLFWQLNQTKNVKIASGLLGAIGKKSVLTDWEGKICRADAGLELRPEVVYFLRNPDMNAVAKWTDRGQVLQEFRKEPVLDTTVIGHYRPGKLFGPEMQVLAPEKLRWHELSRYVSHDLKPMAAGLHGRFAVSFGEDGCDLMVQVKDAVHCQKHADGSIWAGDSVQFAIDAVGKGFPADRIEFSAALTPAGPLLWKECAPSLKSDLPGQYTMPRNPVKYGRVKVVREAGGLTYKIHVDRSDLYPFSYLPNQPVRMAVLVNNDDGSGRSGWLEWASGIGGMKDPARYGTMTVDLPSQTIFSQKDLKFPWTPPRGNTAMEAITSGPDAPAIKLSCPAAKQNAAVSTGANRIVAGGSYKISFQARGNVNLIGILWLYSAGKKAERHNFLERFSLDRDWQSVEKTVTIPSGTEKVVITLLDWQQAGWFEVKQFVMKTNE